MRNVGVGLWRCPLKNLADVEAQRVELLRKLLDEMLQMLQVLREGIVSSAVKDLPEKLQSCKDF